ncbi:MAG TPA: FAD:protein FMN transferase [Pilimelia sp.]|nr:FAD:protein FMN transferase [Pilimelia sp.]
MTTTSTITATTAAPPATAATPRRAAPVWHDVRLSTATFRLCLIPPAAFSRRRISEALADAVAELRAMDTAFSPLRRDSLVSRVRRGELAPETYAPLAELVRRCAAMRAATDGWFDAWAVPGGFDPSGLLKGWAVERAAARLRVAGIADLAVTAGSDVLVRGRGPGGGPWRVGLRHPQRPREVVTVLALTDGAVATTGAGRRGHIVDPHTGAAADELAVATVTGPDLSVADAYATALYAAGPAGLDWFPTDDGYHAVVTAPAAGATPSLPRPVSIIQ